MSSQVLESWVCPDCGLLGLIDDEQAAGVVSIICPKDEGGCGWHGYKGSQNH